MVDRWASFVAKWNKKRKNYGQTGPKTQKLQLQSIAPKAQLPNEYEEEKKK